MRCMPNKGVVAAAMLLAGATAWGQVGMFPEVGFGPPTGCQTREFAGHPSHELHLANPASRLRAEDDLLGPKTLTADGRMSVLNSKEPVANLGLLKMKVAAYMDCAGGSGCYWSDLDAQYRRAEDRLDAEVKAAKKGEKLAMVMDIDETTLSSYCQMKRDDFGYIPELDDAWTMSADASLAIPGAKRLFDKAKSLGVAVFFITGRPGVPDYSAAVQAPDQTEATAKNLRAAGFDGWKGLALRNGGENLMTTEAYKSGERERIVDQGYRIVMSVGDQWSDLLGDPQAQVSVKLPNPMYFLP